MIHRFIKQGKCFGEIFQGKNEGESSNFDARKIMQHILQFSSIKNANPVFLKEILNDRIPISSAVCGGALGMSGQRKTEGVRPPFSHGSQFS